MMNKEAEQKFEQILASLTVIHESVQETKLALMNALLRYNDAMKELCDKADVLFPPRN